MHQYGLIGYPLSHSFSQKYFMEKFANEGLVDYSYQNFPINDIRELRSLLEQYPDLRGFNVTIPYKEQIIPFLDELDSVAEEIGAVNTVQIARNEKDLHLKGYNTDVYGFSKSLQEWFQVSSLTPYRVQEFQVSGFKSDTLSGARVSGFKFPFRINQVSGLSALVLGTGGASKAVVYALSRLGIDARLVSRKDVKGVFKTYEQLTGEDFATHSLIVNTTPLGMFPNVGECPAIPYQYLTEKHFLYDLVYNPEETLFMRNGREMGASVHNGKRMLHLQADKAWEFFKLNLSVQSSTPQPLKPTYSRE